VRRARSWGAVVSRTIRGAEVRAPEGVGTSLGWRRRSTSASSSRSDRSDGRPGHVRVCLLVVQYRLWLLCVFFDIPSTLRRLSVLAMSFIFFSSHVCDLFLQNVSLSLMMCCTGPGEVSAQSQRACTVLHSNCFSPRPDCLSRLPTLQTPSHY
jgi:hypothetical protein